MVTQIKFYVSYTSNCWKSPTLSRFETILSKKNIIVIFGRHFFVHFVVYTTATFSEYNLKKICINYIHAKLCVLAFKRINKGKILKNSDVIIVYKKNHIGVNFYT